MHLSGAVVLSWWCLALASGQAPSPCPGVFDYAPQEAERGRWYGLIRLKADTDVAGVLLRIHLDKVSLQLGNWFGRVETQDHTVYQIRNDNKSLTAGQTTNVRFFVRYEEDDLPPPSLRRIFANGKQICPRGLFSQTTTTESPNWFVIPENSKPDDPDEYFPGDFFGQQAWSPPPLLAAPGGQEDAFQCGITVQSVPLVTFGQAITEGEFPWHAALYFTKGFSTNYACGASLVTLRHLVTAAHCVTKPRTRTPVATEMIIIYLGKHYLELRGNNVQEVPLKEIRVHPDYAADNYLNDMAVLVLSKAAKVTPFVRPVCLDLVQRPADGEELVGRTGTVVGWGFDENNRLTDQLTKTEMPVVEQSICRRSYPAFFSYYLNENSFCAGYRNGTSVCNGDSGGGMVMPVKDKRTGRTSWFLKGVVSLGVRLQNTFTCDPDHFAIFTSVDKYAKWLGETIDER